MAKRKPVKIEIGKTLTATINQSKAIVFTDYTGLKVSQINELRTKVKSAGGDYAVTKNTVFRVSLKNTPLLSLESQLAEKLSGPTATLFAISDEVSPIKALTQFAKASGIPTIKFGILGKDIITSEEVTKLSTLPTKEVLVSKLLGLLNAPMSNLVSVLTGNHRKLVYVLSKLAKKAN